MPHAIRRLWPITITGCPGRVTPAMSRVGEVSCASYQMLGSPNPRCGSLDSNACPVALRLGATAHELLPDKGGAIRSAHGLAAASAKTLPANGAAPGGREASRPDPFPTR